MKRFLIVAALLLVPSLAHAAGWSALEFTPTRTMNAGTIENRVGYMVADGGTVYKTTDDGQSWFGATGSGSEGTDVGLAVDLNDVIILDDYSVVAVGSDLGASDGETPLIRSTDGGLTWHAADSFAWDSVETTSGATVAYSDIVEGSSGVSVTVGEDGVIKRSSDYGKNWIAISSNTDADLHAVARSGNTYAAVGAGSTVLISSDGGVTWNAAAFPVTDDDEFRSVDVVSDSVIYVASRDRVYVTEDGGATWDIAAQADASTYIADVDFYDAAHGAMALSYAGPTEAARYTKITENGSDWSSLTSYGTSDASIKINDIHYYASGQLYGFGASDLYNSISYAGYYRYVFNTTTLIKTPCVGVTSVDHPCRAVYYYGVDGKRHAFDSEGVFFSWYADFDDVITVSDDFMATITLGAAMPYRPGSTLVKFQSTNRVYAVADGGVLRGINSESVAAELYGSDWAAHVDDISDAFYSHYTFGADINTASDYSVTATLSGSTSVNASTGW